ncbi:MAG: Hsp20/alpha crystallin family protein [Chloroflexota bacterium]
MARLGTELVPWRPIRDVERVFDEMEQTFEDVFGRPFYPVAWGRLPAVRAWSPTLEVFELEDEYVMKAELPGMKRDDIDVSISENTLTIKGERKASEEVQNASYFLCERCYGSFERSISFPTSVDASKVKANYENGVLEMKIPKVPEAKPKKVDIMVGQSQR